MAETTLRAAVERFLGLWAEAKGPLKNVSVIAAIHQCPYAGPPLGDAVDAMHAAPDDPRDAKLRAFADSLMDNDSEKLRLLLWSLNQGTFITASTGTSRLLDEIAASVEALQPHA